MKLPNPRRLWIKGFTALLLLGACQSSDNTTTPNPEPSVAEEPTAPLSPELQLVWEDMTKAHEGLPSGVPDSYGWGKEPRIGYGNNPPKGWNAALPWGQVYTDVNGNTTTNTRFQIRNMQLWYLSKKENQWREWSATSNIAGANYAENFQNDTNIEADIRMEGENGGGISATLVAGYNFHFWNNEGRTTIDPTDIAAVWTSLESRLILDKPEAVDDRNEARLMMSAGADYWEDSTVAWDQWKTNGDIFIGRFRYLTSEWQTFHAHTLTEEQLRKSPPPIN